MEKKFTVEFYEKENGEKPCLEFLNTLEVKLRAKQETNIVRNLYFFFVGNKIIVTHGFRKKTQKTPPGEIERQRIIERIIFQSINKRRKRNDTYRSIE